MKEVNTHNSSVSYVEGRQTDVYAYIQVIQHVSHTFDVSRLCVTFR